MAAAMAVSARARAAVVSEIGGSGAAATGPGAAASVVGALRRQYLRGVAKYLDHRGESGRLMPESGGMGWWVKLGAEVSGVGGAGGGEGGGGAVLVAAVPVAKLYAGWAGATRVVVEFARGVARR